MATVANPHGRWLVKLQMKRKMRTLVLIGRRWFNRTFGNTYHSVEIIVDGKQIHKIDYAYGYGSQWEYNACVWLTDNKYLPGRETKVGESLWCYCERMGIEYVITCTDVPRKKNL